MRSDLGVRRAGQSQFAHFSRSVDRLGERGGHGECWRNTESGLLRRQDGSCSPNGQGSASGASEGVTAFWVGPKGPRRESLSDI